LDCNPLWSASDSIFFKYALTALCMDGARPRRRSGHVLE
jgi:hypothetical protein